MAIGEFRTAIKAAIGNVWTTVATGTVKASYVIQLDIASTGNTGVQVSVRLYDVSEATYAFLVKSAPLPLGSALQIIDGQKMVLESGDLLEVVCDTGGETVDVIGSVIDDVNP